MSGGWRRIEGCHVALAVQSSLPLGDDGLVFLRRRLHMGKSCPDMQLSEPGQAVSRFDAWSRLMSERGNAWSSLFDVTESEQR